MPGQRSQRSHPGTVEQGQTTVIGTVASGLAGDVLSLTAVTASAGGTLSLQSVSGVQEVVFTAPGSIATSAFDTVNYGIVDQHNDVTATATATVQLVSAIGPTIIAATPTTVEHGQMTVLGTVVPAYAGDTLSLTGTTVSAGGSLGLKKVGSVEEVVFTAPGTIPMSALDTINYGVVEHHMTATGTVTTTATVQLDSGPTVTVVTPGTVENGQTTIIGMVTPGLPGDTLTLKKTAGSGTLTLGPVQNGTQEVIYTAQSRITSSTTDAVSYTVSDEYRDATASASASIQLDAGPTITATTPMTVEKSQTTVIGTVTPGLLGDTVTLTQTGGKGTLVLGAVLGNGVQQVIYIAPSNITSSVKDSVTYTVTDEYDDVVAKGSASVQLDAGPAITPTAPSSVENGQTTVVASVKPGVAGDTLTLTQIAGTGVLALGTVQANGLQQVIYTAPSTIINSTTDAFSYTISDQHHDITATATASVQLDSGPTILAATPTTVEHGQTTVLGTILPGVTGDKFSLTGVTASAGGTVSLKAVGGVEEVVFIAPGSIAASVLDTVNYGIVDQHNDVTATATATVQLDAGPTITPVTPATVENSQTTVIGTVTPGLPGDTLTLKKTAGSGTLTFGPVQNGTQAVIYTAPAHITGSTIDTISYTVFDEYKDATANGSASVQLDAGPTLMAVATTTAVAQGQTTVVGTVVPGLPTDTLHVTSSTAAYGTLTVQNNQALYTPTAAEPSTDQFTYTLTDPFGGSVIGTVIIGDDSKHVVSGGDGFTSVIMGNGPNTVTLKASYNAVDAGNGNDSLTATGGNNTITLGNGNDVVHLGGSGNAVVLGNGKDTVTGTTGDMISLVGNNGTLALQGTNETVFLGPSNDTVSYVGATLTIDLPTTQVGLAAIGNDVIANAGTLAGTIDLVGLPSGYKAMPDNSNTGTIYSFGTASIDVQKFASIIIGPPQ